MVHYSHVQKKESLTFAAERLPGLSMPLPPPHSPTSLLPMLANSSDPSSPSHANRKWLAWFYAPPFVLFLALKEKGRTLERGGGKKPFLVLATKQKTTAAAAGSNQPGFKVGGGEERTPLPYLAAAARGKEEQKSHPTPVFPQGE